MRRRPGENGLVIRAKDNGQDADETQFFATVEPIGEIQIGRRGVLERTLTLELGRNLMRAPPLPSGP
jgi:hypothetical protein